MIKRNNIAIIGDFILDCYWEGQVDRISPEAPIPVVSINKREFYTLGGAANVASNCAALGSNVTVFGMIGCDEKGRIIRSLLDEKGINCEPLEEYEKIKTIFKVRVLGNNQQIVRLDYNDHLFVTCEMIQAMIEKLVSQLAFFDVLIISDYGKGTCTRDLCKKIINECKKYKKIIIVDPKGKSWDKYEGATLITPNLKELADVLGEKIENEDYEIEKKGLKIFNTLQIENLLVTRSDQGMTFLNKDGKLLHIRSCAKEVYDVSGAGDTVVAAIGSLYNRYSLEKVLQIATIAAGIVVGKKNTAVANWSEIEKEISNNNCGIEGKIVGLNELIEKIEGWRKKGEKIVFTNGCYDLLHRGHIVNLTMSASYADHLIVGINSDCSVKRLKGSTRPINNEGDRAYLLAALECVDAVIIFDEDTPEKLIKNLHPDIITKGGDYHIEQVIGREYAGEVKIIPYLKGYSSSNIIHMLKED